MSLVSHAYSDSQFADESISLEAPTVSEHPFSVGVNMGSLGIGANLSLPLGSDASLRANINKFKYNLNKKYKKVSFKGNLNLLNAGLLIDYFPANNFFRLSVGGYLNKNKVSGTSKFSKSITVKVHNVKRKITDRVKIESEVKFNNISPYVGVGWGNNIQKKGWNTTLDIGMMYQGLPKITFDTSSKYAITKDRLKKDIKREKARLKRFANKYKFYPVLVVGISYSF